MSFCDLADVRLFYTQDGSGDPPLLFVHGYTCDSHDWSWQLAHFAGSHRVIAVDLRGHGRSSAPPDYSMPAMAQDLADLLEHLDCGPAVVITHSLGAVIGSVLAVEHPERVQAFFGIDPAYLYPEAVLSSFEPQIEIMQETSNPSEIATLMLSGTYSEISPAWLRTWHRRRIAGTPAAALRGAFLNSFGTPGAPGTSAQYLARRECPTFVLWANEANAAAERELLTHPTSEIVVWPGCAHWPHIDRPDEVNALFDTWLARLPA